MNNTSPFYRNRTVEKGDDPILALSLDPELAALVRYAELKGDYQNIIRKILDPSGITNFVENIGVVNKGEEVPSYQTSDLGEAAE